MEFKSGQYSFPVLLYNPPKFAQVLHPPKGGLHMPSESAAPAQDLRLEIERKPDAVVIRCSGRIVSSTASHLQETVRPLIAENKRVVLDLTNVNYLDSSGLGSIVGLWVNATKNGCDLRLIKLNDRIKELLRISNLVNLEGDQDYFGY
jgi:anti-sigma B factor antagonist